MTLFSKARNLGLLGLDHVAIDASKIDAYEPLIQKMMDDYDETIRSKHNMMDAGYDVPRIYESIHSDYKAQAVISLN